MRGNQYSKSGDPMMTRSQRRKLLRSKLAKTTRVKKLKNRLRGIRHRGDRREGNSHMTALMESYVMRRKQERAAAKEAAEAAPPPAASTADSTGATAAPPLHRSKVSTEVRNAAAAGSKKQPSKR